jgi:hypothetical protein
MTPLLGPEVAVIQSTRPNIPAAELRDPLAASFDSQRTAEIAVESIHPSATSQCRFGEGVWGRIDRETTLKYPPRVANFA